MSNICFISYSAVDALEFAYRLTNDLEGSIDTNIQAWLDKRDLNPARDWDEQIVEALKHCNCLIFVMTKDSISPGSICKNEWAWALKNKIPVIPLLLDKNIDQPFGLGNLQWIDFTCGYDYGIAKLKKFLRRMDSPEGQVDFLKDRLAETDRELLRADPKNRKHIQLEINALKKQIRFEQKLIDESQNHKYSRIINF